MTGGKNNRRLDFGLFAVVLLLYLCGQFLIGSYLPDDNSFHFDAPADVDFLYYAGIINQMKHGFPPQNPAYGGVPLSQSFLQYYPTMVVSWLVNPYLAMRIVNVIFLLVMAGLLARYFARGWGVGLAVICAGSVGFGLINSLGIDLIARGFNHYPFFMALVIGLFEKRRRWLRYLCLFLLGWLHSYSALLVLVFLVIVTVREKFGRQRIIDSLLCLLGLISAASITVGVADKPFYFPFVEGFRFDLTNIWMHALPAAIMALMSRRAAIIIMFGVGLLFGAFFHYNPFFPVFILYFSAGWGAMDIIGNDSRFRLPVMVVSLLLLAGFVYGAIDKYDSRQGRFVPIIDREYDAAIRWLDENTLAKSVILAAPFEPESRCRIMEKRAVYLGYIPHVAHLGIDWRSRAQKIINYFRKASVYMAETDYIIYGPRERNLFPGYNLDDEPVFRSEGVRIWETVR